MADTEVEFLDKSKIEDYRHPHESLTEWKLRRTFLLAHAESLPIDRLVCLASCFINVECYGCKYPGPVMTELRELAQDIRADIDEHREKIQSHRKVQFVKASGDAKSAQTGKRKMEEASGNGAADRQQTASPLGSSLGQPFVRDPQKSSLLENSSNNKTDELLKRDREMEEKFFMLVKYIKEAKSLGKNAVETVNIAVSKAKMAANPSFIKASKPGCFACQLLIDCIPVATGEAPNKKLSKHHAFEKAVDLLCKPGLMIIIHDNGNRNLEWHAGTMPEKQIFPHDLSYGTGEGQSLPPDHPRKRGPASLLSTSLASFIIVEPLTKHNAVTAVSILHQSVAFNKATLEFDFSSQLVGGVLQYKCRLFIDQESLVEVAAENKQTAKRLAAEKTLEQLKHTSWTIQIKKHEDAEESGITKEEILGEAQNLSQAIPSSNIGSKLLQKMGWCGGGVGREGSGRSEPVSVAGAINRQGLGLSEAEGMSHDFLPRIKATIESYASSEREDDLVFSPDFSKTERAVIHRECQKLGLKSHSHRSGDSRYLVASRKRNASQLISHIQRQGGETSKYILVPPPSS